MAISIHIVDYYNTTVQNQPGEGYQLLHHLAEEGVDLVAFTAVPVGDRTQFGLFPKEPTKMEDLARRAGLKLDGPHSAILVQGDDTLGMLAGILQKLWRANINVFASSGVSDGKGDFGCILYVGAGQQQAALEALQE